MAGLTSNDRNSWRCEAQFVAGAVAQYVGAMLAIGVLFDPLGALTAGWLRLAFGAVISALFVLRPSGIRAMLTTRLLAVLAPFGISLALMNLCFYQAIDSLPLGTAVAIEFCGPIAVAALGRRGAGAVIAVIFAVTGVALVSGPQFGGSAGAGVLWAGAAAVLWATYIVLGHRVGALPGSAGSHLALAMVIGAVLTAPWPLLAGGQHSDGFGSRTGQLLAVAAVVGVLSSAIPYAIEMRVMQRVRRDYFALVLALLPSVAMAVEALATVSLPSLSESVGTVCVCAAIVLARPGRSPGSVGDQGIPERAIL